MSHSTPITTASGDVIMAQVPVELFFSDTFMEDEPMYRVFELPDGFDLDGLLHGLESSAMQDEDELLKIENDLDNMPIACYIKGENNNPAMLCTDRNTFEITKVDTSNTVLLMESKTGEIHGRVSCTYEVTPTIVRLRESIEKVLPSYPKNGLSSSQSLSGNVKFRNDNQKKAMTITELESCIRASRQEIMDCLTRECHAICDKSSQQWYLLDDKLFFQIYELILLIVAENAVSDKIVLKLETVYKDLGEDYDVALLEHVLDILKLDASLSNNLFECELDLKKLYTYNAISLFNTHNKWRVKDFLHTWHESVSSFGKNEPPLEFLTSQGYCILIAEDDKNKSSEDNTMVQYIDRRLLPAQFKERLAIMFKAKPKWTIEEMTIYLSELFCCKNEAQLQQELEAMLKKHCKVQQSVLRKEKFFMSK